MAGIYKVAAQWNLANLGIGMNVFYFEVQGPTTPADAVVRSNAAEWLERMYNAYSSQRDNNYTFANARVFLVNQKGDTIRDLGTISPSIGAGIAGEGVALTTALSSFARTSVPKVRGSKRWPGLHEIGIADGLLTNTALSLLVDATAEWLAGPNPGQIFQWLAGVVSSKTEDFVPFSGSGAATNIPGTQVTRKPGRGA